MDCKYLKKLIIKNKGDVKKAQKALEKSMKDYEKCKKKEKALKAKAKAKAKKKNKTTVAQMRANCKNEGKVYDVKTKKCREKKKRQKNSKKTQSKRTVPQFFDAWEEVNPGYPSSDYGTGIEPEEENVTKYILDTGKITGDIIYVGSGYETRQEYGVVVVDLDDKRKYDPSEYFYGWYGYSPDEVTKELTQYKLLKNSKKAIEDFVKWNND